MNIHIFKQEKNKYDNCLVNNNGYLILEIQKEFLKQNHGTHPNWGLTMPNFQKVCKSFKIHYKKIYKSKK